MLEIWFTCFTYLFIFSYKAWELFSFFLLTNVFVYRRRLYIISLRNCEQKSYHHFSNTYIFFRNKELKKSKADYKKIPPFLNLNCEKNFNLSNFTSKWEHIHRIPPSQHPSIYIVFVLWPQKTIYFLLVPLTIPLLHSFFLPAPDLTPLTNCSNSVCT